MNIAGIAGSNHPTLKKGDIIEFSPNKKMEVLSALEASKHSEEGFRRLTTQTKVLNLQVIKGSGINSEGIEEPDQYQGKISLTYRPLRLRDDRLFSEKTITISLHFQDTKNSLGLPDFKTLSYKES